MYLAVAASGGLTVINVVRILRMNNVDSITTFSTAVWVIVFVVVGIMILRMRNVIPLELTETKLISRLGFFTKTINLSDVSSIQFDNGVYHIKGLQGKLIGSFGNKDYKDLSFLRKLPQFNNTQSTQSKPGESMKKTFVITFAISFGAVSALLAVAITLLATGVVKRSLFGGYSFSFEDRKAESIANEYDRKSTIAKGLIINNASLVDGDDDRMKKIVCEMTNPNDDLTEDLVAFDVMLIKQGKVVKIISTVDQISLKKGESKRIIMDLITKEKLDYDSIEMISKG
jgi:hypothetical protein